MSKESGMQRLGVFVVAVAFLASACSVTPGDAAYRMENYEQAANLYWRGARNGDEIAMLKLGLLIENGAVNDDRFGQAVFWFEQACMQGSVVGCHNAGVHFEYGKNGLDMDYEKASSFYRKAAESGYIQSQYNLGSMYANRHLVGDIEGLKWLLLAQQNADKCASEELCQWILKDPPGHVDKLKGRMTQAQIEQAHRRVAQLSPAS